MQASLTGSRRLVVWIGFLAIVAGIPQARTLLATGIAGGAVIGGLLILLRHHVGSGGPRRGTPIVLFPKPVNFAHMRA